MRIREAYRILSVSQPLQPDTGIAKAMPAFSWKEKIRDLKDKELAVLCLLCERRLSDYRNATVSQSEVESLTGMAADEAGFILWYLREKGAVTISCDNSDHAISALGIDLLQSAHLPE